MKKRKLWLCLPPAVLCGIDQTITLIHQPAAYWSGGYRVVNEANPQFNWLLRQHPLAFEAGILAWVAFFSILIVLLPSRAAFIVSLTVTIAHTWGASTWISHYVARGYWVTLVLCFVSAVLIALAAERAGLVSYVKNLEP